MRNSQYVYGIDINDKNVHQVENVQPSHFKNVKVYAANPWSQPLNGNTL